jgi:hypothetical protein
MTAKSVDITKDLKNPSFISPALRSLRAAAKSPPPAAAAAAPHVPSIDSTTSHDSSVNNTVNSPTRVSVPVELYPILGHGDAMGVVNQLKYRITPEVRLSFADDMSNICPLLSLYLSCPVVATREGCDIRSHLHPLRDW